MSTAVTVFVAVFVVVFFAAAGQSVAGFGFGLLAVPPLALLVDPRSAVVVAGLTGLLLSLTTAVRERAYARWSAAGWLLGACTVGLPAGVVLLRWAPERALTALIGLSVLGGTWVVWRGVRLRHPTPVLLTAIGGLVGVLTTATGTSGPPLVAALHALGYSPRVLRATVAVIFSLTGLAAAAAFAVAGLVTVRTGMLAAAGLPAVVLGWGLGDRIFSHLDPARFRQVLLVALLASAALTIASASAR